MFENSVPVDERKKLDRYLDENRIRFSQEREIVSRIEKDANGQVALVLLINERETPIFSIRIRVSSEEQALLMRSRWESNSESIYDFVWDALLDKKQR